MKFKTILYVTRGPLLIGGAVALATLIPQAKAHIGGNQVTGFSSSNTATSREAGIVMTRLSGWTMTVI